MNEKLRQVRPADVLFKPGAVVATPGALATFTRDELFTALMRHPFVMDTDKVIPVLGGG